MAVQCRPTADEYVPWGSLVPFIGAHGARMAAACVCHAALESAAVRGVAVPMYRVRSIPGEGVCVIEARRAEPRGRGEYPSPWLAEGSILMPVLALAREREEQQAAFHPLPQVALGPSVRELVSCGAHGLGDAALERATGITALDVSDNPNVTTVAPFASSLRRLTARGDCGIGDSGVAHATRLEYLDAVRNHKITTFAPFSVTLRHIGGYLAGCDRLVRVDLSSPMPALSSIGDDFLNDCSGITAIDLGGLANVTRIGDNFLREMDSLTALDLRPLSRVESVGNGFLWYCSSVATIDLGSLANVTRIGDNFLREMRTLSTPLSRVESVGGGFLVGCDGLEISRVERGESLVLQWTCESMLRR